MFEKTGTQASVSTPVVVFQAVTTLLNSTNVPSVTKLYVTELAACRVRCRDRDRVRGFVCDAKLIVKCRFDLVAR